MRIGCQGKWSRRGHLRSSRVALWAVAAVTALVASTIGTGPLAAAAYATPHTSAGRAAGPPDPTITVHGGGVRAAGGTVQPLPDGAVFTASAVGTPDIVSCITAGGTGTCGVPIPTLPGIPWDVVETSPPPGYYLNPTLDSGPSFSASPAPYQFRQAFGSSPANVDVPAASPNVTVADAHSPPQTFSGLLATSLDDPNPPASCGVRIAIVLDQSTAMADSQPALRAAANDTVKALTGMPSTVAIFTFGSVTGPHIDSTSTVNPASAQPLHDFINGLPPTPALGPDSNWDIGLDQVPSGQFDVVILVTDRSPTASRIRAGDGVQSEFTDTEQAIFTANRLKAEGTRMLGLGIDMFTHGGTQNLRAVTGPEENHDYFLSTDADLAAHLRDLAAGECDHELVINKLVESPNGGLVGPTPDNTNGWTFHNTISEGTIASPVTTSPINGDNGFATAAVTIPGGATPEVSVTEELQPGFELVSAECFIAGAPVPTSLSGDTARFAAEAGQPMECTFTNRQPLGLPVILTFPSPPQPVGTPIEDKAQVTGGVEPITGEVTFELFPPGDPVCGGPPIFSSTVPLIGGTAASPPFVTNEAGTWHWVAMYDGDPNNGPVRTECHEEPVEATRAIPQITTFPSPGGLVGTAIADKAEVTGGFDPTGTVTFELFGPGDPFCTGPVFVSPNEPLSGGSAASGSFVPFEAGTWHWVAIYDGDPNNEPVATGCHDEPVDMKQDLTTISTAPSAGGLIGVSVFDTATVEGGFDPTGTVTFELFGPGDPTCSRPPIFSSTDPLVARTAISGPFAPGAAGTYEWIAHYNGDPSNTGSSSACGDEPVVIGAVQPDRITTVPSPGGPVGIPIHDTATVSGGASPTGTVTFELFAPGDTTCSGAPVFSSTVPLIGESATSVAFATNAVGSYRWIAIYNGDANNASVRSNCDEEPVDITRAGPTIKSAPSPAGTVGIAISDTADVVGGFNPAGVVTFELFPPADPTCGGSPAFIDTVPLIVSGASSGLFATTAAGTWHWVAIYNGDANNLAAATHCVDEPVTIDQAHPVIATAPSPGGPVGTSLRDTATVSGGFDPTGTVTFELFPPTDATCGGPPVFTSTNPLTPGGASSGSFAPAADGTYRWVATYNGDANNTPVRSGCQDEPVTISRGTPSIETKPVPGGPIGSPIFDTATVTGSVNPTGTVTFELFQPGSTTCSGLPIFVSTDPLIGGTATSGSFTPAAAGTYRWVATYNGDANNTPVSSGCQDEPVEITRTTPTITTTPSAGGEVGAPISDAAATVSGFNPTGTVTFELFPPADATCSGPPVFTFVGTLSGGGATSGTFTATAAGTWRWVVVYHGDTGNAPVSSDCPSEQVVVTRATPAIESTPSAGGPIGTAISDTANVSGGHDPTGTVTFELFGPADASCGGPPIFTQTDPLIGGTASSGPFTTTAAGTFQWVAAYNGDADNAAVGAACHDEPVQIGRAQPVVMSSPSAGGVVGTEIGDAAIVEQGFHPTGTVSFSLFGPGDDHCANDLVAGDPTFRNVPLMESGAPSPAFTTTAVGVYQWVVAYSGDANNEPAGGTCGDPTEQVATTVAPALPPTGSAEPVAGMGGAGLLLSGLLVVVAGRRRRRPGGRQAR